jgi:hypothetical protein
MPIGTHQYELLRKQAKSINDVELGIVQDVEDDYVLTQGRFGFYIPMYLIEKYDGNSLWFRITEDEAKSKFMVARYNDN